MRSPDLLASLAVSCDYRGDSAARFTADGAVALDIFTGRPDLVRWGVSNALTADQRCWLELNVPDLPALEMHKIAGHHTSCTCGTKRRPVIEGGVLAGVTGEARRLAARRDHVWPSQ